MRLHYREHGSGDPPLLLVHGWGGDLRAWDPPPFAGHRVLAADLRGHGRSPVPASGYSPAELAADLVPPLTGPVVAVGHSMGAQVVTALAVEHPELVTALVVIDPAYGAGQAEADGFADRLARLHSGGAEAAVAQLGVLPPAVREQMLATPGPVLAACYAGMYTEPGAFGARPAAEQYLARRDCPVLCLRSQAEPARWESRLPAPAGSQVVVWADTGHFLRLEHPSRTTRLVADWLRSLEGDVVDDRA